MSRGALLRTYLRRLRHQSAGRTIKQLASPRRVAKHLKRLSTGDASARTNPYIASFSRDDEMTFVATLLRVPVCEVDEVFGELESDRTFLASIREDYARRRPEWPDGLHVGRKKVWYAIVRLARPATLIETGVQDGLTSALLLKALERNGTGRLISIDLPSTDLPADVDGPGWLVPSDLSVRWSLRLGDAGAILPRIAREAAPIGLFINDTDRSDAARLAEFRAVRPYLAADGIMATEADFDRVLVDQYTRETGATIRVSARYWRDMPSRIGAWRYD